MKLSRRDLIRIASGFAVAGLHRASASDSVPAQQISSTSGVRVAVFSDGSYQISIGQFGWTFGGAVAGPIGNISVSSGADSLGDWQEIDLAYQPARTCSIRLYDGQAIVLFSTTYGQAQRQQRSFSPLHGIPARLVKF